MKYTILSLILLSSVAWGGEKFITVAVIDTGLDKNIKGYENGICKMGHKDFTGTGLHDIHGHGTNISGLIHKYAEGRKYCQVILKFWDPNANNYPSNLSLRRMIMAIRHAVAINVDFINISGGGTGFSAAEMVEINRALAKGITVVTVAGNEKCNLNKHKCNFYPAMYDKRIVVVGNGITEGSRAPTSNWGSVVDFWIDGTDKKGEYGKKMTGTSQAAAIQTGKLVRIYVQGRRHTKSKHERSRVTVRRMPRNRSL